MTKQLGTIHYARYERSVRLQRLLEFLYDGQWHTTLEIIHGADVCAVSSAVCELRENGFGVTRKGNRPAMYRLDDPAAARKLARRLIGFKEAA